MLYFIETSICYLFNYKKFSVGKEKVSYTRKYVFEILEQAEVGQSPTFLAPFA